jgi:hypothetical protein
MTDARLDHGPTDGFTRMRPSGPVSFWTVLRRRVVATDLLALVAIPVLLVGVFLLPEGVRTAFVFDYTDPSLVSAYAAHAVHLRVDHLVANLVGYGLLAGTCYLLAALAGRRRLFWVATVSYLVAFPPVLSSLNLAVPRNAVSYGFSGLNLAFLGLLPVLLTAYAGRRLHPSITTRHAPLLFLTGTALIPLVGLPSSPVSWALAAASLFGAVGYAVAVAGRSLTRRRLTTLLTETALDAGWLDLAVASLVLFVGYLVVAFPTDLSPGTVVPNLYVHLLAFCLAFLVPFVLLASGLVDDWRELSSTHD